MGTLLCVVACLVPLLIAPHVLFYFDVTPKVAVLLLGTAVLLPWAALRGPRRWFYLLILAQGASIALSTVFSTNRALSVVGTNWRRFGAVSQAAVLLFTLIAAAYLAAHPEWLRSLLAAISAATGAAIALYAVLQYFGWDPWLPRSAYHIGEGIWTIVRPPGTLGYVSYLATYLLYVVFAGAALALLAKGRLGKVLGIATAGLASAAIVLSGTRAAILGLVVGLVFLAAWLRVRKAILPAAAVVAIFFAFYYSPPGQMLRSRTRWFIEDPLGGARLLLWRDSLSMASHYWVTGSGIETFPSEFPRYQSAALARAFPDYYHESPHNIFLDAFTSQGLPGLLVLILLCAFAFQAAWQAKTSLAGALAAGFLAALISQQFTVFTLPTALYFYLTLAMLSPVPCSRLTSWVSLPIALLLAIFAIRLLMADRDLALVRQDLEQGNLPAASQLYTRARKWEPEGMTADLWYSRAMALAAQKSPLSAGIPAWRQGFEAAFRAIAAAEDRQNAWYNLAAFYASQNDFVHTEESLRSAILWAPNWFKPHWMLAQVLRAAGRLADARAEADRAAYLDAGKHPEVARTRAELERQQK